MNMFFGGKEYHEVTATIIVKDIRLNLLPASGANGGAPAPAPKIDEEGIIPATAAAKSNASNSYTHYSVALERQGKWDCVRKTRWINTEYEARDPHKVRFEAPMHQRQISMAGNEEVDETAVLTQSHLVWSLLNTMTFDVNLKTDQEIKTNATKIDEIVGAVTNGGFWATVGLPENTSVKSKTAHPLTAAVHCFNIHQAQDEYQASLRDAPLPTPSNPKKAFYGARETVVPCKDLKIDLASCVNSPIRESKHKVPVHLPGLSAPSGGSSSPVGFNSPSKYTLNQPQNAFLEITLCCVGVSKKGEAENSQSRDRPQEPDSPEKLRAPRESVALDKDSQNDAKAAIEAASTSSLPNTHLLPGIDISKLDKGNANDRYLFKHLPYLVSKNFRPHYHEYAIVLDAISLDVTLSTASDIQRFGFGFFVDVTNGTPSTKMEYLCGALRAPEDSETVAKRVREANAASSAFSVAGGINTVFLANGSCQGRSVCDFSTIPITTDSPSEKEASWVICSCDSESYSNVAIGNRTMCTSRFKTDNDGRCRSTQKAQLSFGIIRVDKSNEWSTEVAWTQPVDLAEEIINVENFPDDGISFASKFAYGEKVTFRLRRRCFDQPELHLSPVLDPTAAFADINPDTNKASDSATERKSDPVMKATPAPPEGKSKANSIAPPKDDPFAEADSEHVHIPTSKFVTPAEAPPPPVRETVDKEEEDYIRATAAADQDDVYEDHKPQYSPKNE